MRAMRVRPGCTLGEGRTRSAHAQYVVRREYAVRRTALFVGSVGRGGKRQYYASQHINGHHIIMIVIIDVNISHHRQPDITSVTPTLRHYYTEHHVTSMLYTHIVTATRPYCCHIRHLLRRYGGR